MRTTRECNQVGGITPDVHFELNNFQRNCIYLTNIWTFHNIQYRLHPGEVLRVDLNAVLNYEKEKFSLSLNSCGVLHKQPYAKYAWSDSDVFFGDGNLRQAEAWIVLLAGAVEVNALAQGTLRQFTQWLWIEHPTFQLRGGHFTVELLPPIPMLNCKKLCWVVDGGTITANWLIKLLL